MMYIENKTTISVSREKYTENRVSIGFDNSLNPNATVMISTTYNWEGAPVNFTLVEAKELIDALTKFIKLQEPDYISPIETIPNKEFTRDIDL